MTYLEEKLLELLFSDSKDFYKRLTLQGEMVQKDHIFREVKRLKTEVVKQRRVKDKMTKENKDLRQLTFV